VSRAAAGVYPLTMATEVDDDRYDVVRVLGRGGMGEVRLAEDKRIGRRVALKTMLADTRGIDGASARFTREVLVQGQLEHPSIVPVYDLGRSDNGDPYFTMKCIHGRTLDEILGDVRSGPGSSERYPLRRLLAAFATICQAVAFAHSRGVVHRDLKLENAMIGEFGEVYVLDWGVAKVVDADHFGVPSVSASGRGDASGVVGTPGYMPPEQLRGDPLTPRVDVYALGAMLFEVLTLRPMHGGETISELARATQHPDVDASIRARLGAAGVAPELAAICERATKSDPEQRFAGVADLHEQLQRFLDGDRDLELRRGLSERHTAEGLRLAAVDHAKDALRELGRALALDPDNTRALRAFVDVLAAPPRQVPPEVEAELDLDLRREEGVGGRRGRRANFAFALPVVVAFALGVRAPIVLVVHISAVVLATIVSRRQRGAAFAARRITNFVLLIVSVAVLSRLFGALVLVPTLAASVSVPFAYHAGRRERFLVVIPLALLAVVAPMLLEGLGVLSPSYVQASDGAVAIVPHLASLSSVLTLPSMTLLTAIALAVPLVTIGEIADALKATKRRLLLQRWQLRQLVPDEHRPDGTAPQAPLARAGDDKGLGRLNTERARTVTAPRPPDPQKTIRLPDR
jgi:eukaryotic-like serine/threonine-protein kinase